MFNPDKTIDPQNSAAQELNRGAIARVQRGDLEGALDDFDRAVVADPCYAEAWNNRGMVRHMLARFAEAVADFDRALAVRPEYPEALTNRGRIRQALGDGAAALADFDQALACADGLFAATVLHNRATLCLAEGNVTGALADFDRALAIDADACLTWVSRGLARKQAGDLIGAHADLDRALEKAGPGQEASFLHHRGGVLVLQNDFAGALADYDRALALEPENVILHVSRGNARFHRSDCEAAGDYHTAFRLEPAIAARELARTLTEDAHRDPEAVLDNCAKHLRIRSSDAIAHARRGLTLVLLQRESEARGDLARFLELLPDFEPHLRRLLGLLRPPEIKPSPVRPAPCVTPSTLSVTDAVFASGF